MEHTDTVVSPQRPTHEVLIAKCYESLVHAERGDERHLNRAQFAIEILEAMMLPDADRVNIAHVISSLRIRYETAATSIHVAADFTFGV